MIPLPINAATTIPSINAAIIHVIGCNITPFLFMTITYLLFQYSVI